MITGRLYIFFIGPTLGEEIIAIIIMSWVKPITIRHLTCLEKTACARSRMMARIQSNYITQENKRRVRDQAKALPQHNRKEQFAEAGMAVKKIEKTQKECQDAAQRGIVLFTLR